ncbi:hypothetical protein HN748_05885 [Candidatus Peregrinibacteria bacterium]|jgi:hypothetical protein|nr:hypothetical protein [Candidatus Peregrinibacteria bacterium]MBT7703736.1 hypothetical protein [Candidatus Peregrinibacteria bacterium]
MTSLDQENTGPHLEEAHYQELKAIWLTKVLKTRDHRLDASLYDSFDETFDRIALEIGQAKDDLLKDLYSHLVADSLQEFTSLIKSEYFQLVSKRVLESEDVLDLTDLEHNTVFEDAIIRIYHQLNHLGFDKPQEPLNESPLDHPFQAIDINDQGWDMKLKTAANFKHAMARLFDVHAINMALGILCELKKVYEIPDWLNKQMLAIPAVLRVVMGFQEQIEGVDRREATDLKLLVEEIVTLCQSRFNEKGELSLEVRARADVSIQSSSPNQLLLSLFEPLKNCFHDWKASGEELEGYSEKDQAYASVEVLGEVELRGEKVALVEIRDHGKQIDIQSLRQMMNIGDYELRDYTVGALFNSILRRGITLSGEALGADPHLGIGLDSACQIIQKHGGSMIHSNLQEGGVGCLIMIPTSGKGSPVKLSESGITGRECDEMIAQLADPALAERFHAYQQADRGAHALTHEVNHLQSLTHERTLECDVLTPSTPPTAPLSAPPPAC